MTQLQCMDACLDTLFIEMYQVNIRVSGIARRQAVMCGFVSKTSPPPTLEAFEVVDEDEDDDDGDASTFSIDEMST